jgi:hypothetical protein
LASVTALRPEARAPPGYRLVERYLAPLAPLPRDEADEAGEHELAAHVGDPHRPLEAQELLGITGHLRGGDGRHRGTGRETSRSVSVAILT